MSKRVSTIVPAYNAERTIARAIDSALAQEYADHEIVVVNDGSTDSTNEILERYRHKVRILSVPNGGPAKARNSGVAVSTGELIAFLDADDVWLPEKLNTMVAALEQNPAATLAFSECQYIDNDGLACGESSLGHSPSMDGLLTPRPMPILTSTWVLSRTRFDQIGGFNEGFPGPGLEDTWALLLLRELGEFVYVPKSLTLYRSDQNGTTADKYRPGMYLFISLLKDRYGERSKRWIRNTRNSQCLAMLSKVAHQMNDGDKFGALRTLAAILWFRPIFFLGADFRERLFLPQNVNRLRALTSVLSRAHE